MTRATKGEKVFQVFNLFFLITISLTCLFPIIHVLAVSFSSSAAAAAGRVKILPVDFTLASYEYVLEKKEFFEAFFITIKRTLLGSAISMLVTIMTAYPLSKEVREFPQRTFYAWFFFITMLFGGGLVPSYMVNKSLGMIDNFWVLIIPGALSVWNAILMLNFMRGLPKEVSESAFVDGASHWQTLWRIIVPMSKPVLATVLLFTAVGHWNSWFDGLIYMNDTSKYPLQTYMQTVIVRIDFTNVANYTKEEFERLSTVSDRTFKSAQIFVATFPILLCYPFLQKYFVKGIVIGSVKE